MGGGIIMKFVDEYRDSESVRRLSQALARRVTRPWTIMEVCGGQTHSFLKFGLDELLPKEIELIHGPGCPVCVTPVESIDRALSLASRPDLIFCSFGDMLRVPGSERDLLAVKAAGGDVRMVYAPLDAVRLARENPTKQVVFFAVGFETTTPATALAVLTAARQGVENFSLLVAHVLVPPALEQLLSSSNCRVQGFLAAGHVCAVMGYREYEAIARDYRVPIVVTGFEPLDLLQGVYRCVSQLEEGRAEVENSYSRVVQAEGNRSARAMVEEVFEVVPRRWRGMGEIPSSGLALKPHYAAFDAARRFGEVDKGTEQESVCIAGLILQGIEKPHACPAFGRDCTPEHPLGAPMVSAEGACSAYYRYRKVGSTSLRTKG
jgi:hydrogenase expression/formation protein HypD